MNFLTNRDVPGTDRDMLDNLWFYRVNFDDWRAWDNVSYENLITQIKHNFVKRQMFTEAAYIRDHLQRYCKN